ncbi:hypothetical protein JK628_19930 [Shewanella sp. KX20019]|uniref:hypothetical protein n=1 Tax=Shewanella sp. KX20019 TaxID=2803864 RepID=UPI00192669DA|nr:hypothetical protein [Shewanella sp. KX20019]QQX79751.1 hypothetical protein JK628_19930 [Shewanella sp. KX20019]
MIKPTLLLLTTAAVSLSTLANTSVEAQLTQCAAVQDKLDRLICYDNLSASLVTKSAASSSPTSEVIAVASSAAVITSTVNTQADAVEEFGNLKKDKDEQVVTTINLTVSKVTKDPYGALKIQFDNGQLWKQTDSRTFKLKPEQEVYIEKAALGSFILGTKDRNTTIRVKRLK